MSITSVRERPVCNWCDDEYDAPGYNHNYCSAACYYRGRGDRILNGIASEHTICATCYGQLKTTAPAKPYATPGPDHAARDDAGPKDISDGFQYPTERTVIGVDDASRDPYDRREFTRWSCVCGAVDPADEHGFLQALHYEEARANLYRALCDAADRGAIPHFPNHGEYVDAFADPWRGVEYAVGKAVYGNA